MAVMTVMTAITGFPEITDSVLANAGCWLWLTALAVWDLWCRRLPRWLILGFVGMSAAAAFLGESSRFLLLFRGTEALVVTLAGALAARSGRMGWGDVWVLGGMTLWLPESVTVETFIAGFLHAGICATLLETVSFWKKERKDLCQSGNGRCPAGVPLLPFLLIGLALTTWY